MYQSWRRYHYRNQTTGPGFIVPAGGGGGGSSLPTGLTSFWKLDEATGATRNDSVGANHLTDTNTSVSQVGGKVGNGVQFGATGTKILDVTDNASLSPTGSFSFVGWLYADSLPGPGNYPAIVSKDDGSSNRSYALIYNGDNSRLEWSLSANGSAVTSVAASSFGTPSTATWYLFFVYFDDTADEMGVSIDNGTVNTTAFTGSVFDGNAPFQMGRFDNVNWYWEGRIDSVGYWSRKLSAAEVTELYNSGNGKEPPF